MRLGLFSLAHSVMKLWFWGATRQITGSMFLLEFEDEYRLLIDCGLDMEKKDINPKDYSGLFPFEPSMVHAVVLTHAHIDHSGYLPNLLKEGFEGRIVSTAATYELTKILLSDAAALNHRKLQQANQKKKKNKTNGTKKAEQTQGLYFQALVDETLDLFINISYNQRYRLKPGLYITLIPAGHLLGAAHILVEYEENGEKKSICFSGDIGRHDYPLLKDPQKIPEVDYLVCETTYGNRAHQSVSSAEEEVYNIIRETCVEIPGRLIIPAFSVGRTQAMLYTLNKLKTQGKLPPVKVFADSPMALKSSLVYQKYLSWLNDDAREFAEENSQLFDFENLVFLESLSESKAISNYREPCIIISSSGMIQGGRIEHHIRQNLQNSYATILMIGYAAEGTLGYDLVRGKRTSVQIKKKEIPVLARVLSIDAFSGHADVNGLLQFVKSQPTGKLKKIFLVHGEPQSMQDFKLKLEEEGYPQAEIPKRGEFFEL